MYQQFFPLLLMQAKCLENLVDSDLKKISYFESVFDKVGLGSVDKKARESARGMRIEGKLRQRGGKGCRSLGRLERVGRRLREAVRGSEVFQGEEGRAKRSVERLRSGMAVFRSHDGGGRGLAKKGGLGAVRSVVGVGEVSGGAEELSGRLGGGRRSGFLKKFGKNQNSKISDSEVYKSRDDLNADRNRPNGAQKPARTDKLGRLKPKKSKSTKKKKPRKSMVKQLKIDLNQAKRPSKASHAQTATQTTRNRKKKVKFSQSALSARSLNTNRFGPKKATFMSKRKHRMQKELQRIVEEKKNQFYKNAKFRVFDRNRNLQFNFKGSSFIKTSSSQRPQVDHNLSLPQNAQNPYLSNVSKKSPKQPKIGFVSPKNTRKAIKDKFSSFCEQLSYSQGKKANFEESQFFPKRWFSSSFEDSSVVNQSLGVLSKLKIADFRSSRGSKVSKKLREIGAGCRLKDVCRQRSVLKPAQNCLRMPKKGVNVYFNRSFVSDDELDSASNFYSSGLGNGLLRSFYVGSGRRVSTFRKEKENFVVGNEEKAKKLNLE